MRHLREAARIFRMPIAIQPRLLHEPLVPLTGYQWREATARNPRKIAPSVFDRSAPRVGIADVDPTRECTFKSTRHGVFSAALFADARGFPATSDSNSSLKPGP